MAKPYPIVKVTLCKHLKNAKPGELPATLLRQIENKGRLHHCAADAYEAMDAAANAEGIDVTLFGLNDIIVRVDAWVTCPTDCQQAAVRIVTGTTQIPPNAGGGVVTHAWNAGAYSTPGSNGIIHSIIPVHCYIRLSPGTTRIRLNMIVDNTAQWWTPTAGNDSWFISPQQTNGGFNQIPNSVVTVSRQIIAWIGVTFVGTI